MMSLLVLVLVIVALFVGVYGLYMASALNNSDILTKKEYALVKIKLVASVLVFIALIGCAINVYNNREKQMRHDQIAQLETVFKEGNKHVIVQDTDYEYLESNDIERLAEKHNYNLKDVDMSSTKNYTYTTYTYNKK